MNTRNLRAFLRIRLRWAVLPCILLGFPFAAPASATPPGPADGTDIPQHEEISDPPGIPARPTPGTPPSPPVRFGSFISHQVNVAPDGTNIVGDAANEPSIAVDPTHPNHMAIGWRQFDTVSSSFREAGYAYSRDGGLTWTFPGVLEEDVFRSDPVLDADAEGNFYYLGLNATLPPDSVTHTCHLFKSSDGGMTWGPAVFAYGGDKEWMAIDRTDGPGRGHIYSSWNPAFSDFGDDFFTRSVDGGQSFEAPVPMPAVPLFGTMVVDDDGALLVAGKLAGATGDSYVFLRSEDAQYAASPPTFTDVPFSLGGTFLHGAVYPSSPNPDGYLGQIWIDVDRSGGPHDGNIYVLCSVDPPDFPGAPADPLDIHFVRSEDGGQTWSTPVRVNDDPVGNGAWQWFGTMSVAPNGRIDAVWNDSRNTGIAIYSELFYSYSTDGGVTWSPNVQCSGIWSSYFGWPNQAKIGDYYDTVSDLVGVHVAWAATFNAEQDVYYLRIGDYDCNGNGIGDPLDIQNGTSPDTNLNGIPDECEDSAVAVLGDVPRDAGAGLRCAPNPFGASTLVTYDLPTSGRVTLTVYDAAGRRVETLLDTVRPEGIGTLTWSTQPRASGVYFLRLEAEGETRMVKAVVLE